VIFGKYETSLSIHNIYVFVFVEFTTAYGGGAKSVFIFGLAAISSEIFDPCMLHDMDADHNHDL